MDHFYQLTSAMTGAACFSMNSNLNRVSLASITNGSSTANGSLLAAHLRHDGRYVLLHGLPDPESAISLIGCEQVVNGKVVRNCWRET